MPIILLPPLLLVLSRSNGWTYVRLTLIGTACKAKPSVDHHPQTHLAHPSSPSKRPSRGFVLLDRLMDFLAYLFSHGHGPGSNTKHRLVLVHLHRDV